MLAAPLGERSLFVTGPGPASGGSKPGKDSRAQMPEKSGTDAAPSTAPLAGPATGPVVCPEAGTAAVSSAAVTRVDRVFMIAPPFRPVMAYRLDSESRMARPVHLCLSS